MQFPALWWPPFVVPGASYSPSGTSYSGGNYGLFKNFAFRVKFEKDHNFHQNWMATKFEFESGSIHHPLITCNTVITCNWEIDRYSSKGTHGGVSLISWRLSWLICWMISWRVSLLICWVISWLISWLICLVFQEDFQIFYQKTLL